MTAETLSFPALGLEFDIRRVAFELPEFLGSRPLYWYGIIIAAAFLCAIFYVLSRCKKFGLDSDRVMDVVLGGVIAGIVGARLYYVAFSWDTYRDDPVSIFYVWEGGLAIYGGIILSFLVAAVLCRWRRVKMLPMFDLAVGGVFLGQAIGRWGNFVNMEAFGSNTTAPWGMTSPSISWYLQSRVAELKALGVTVDPSVPVHPTFLYESLLCFSGFLLIMWMTSRRRFDGQLSLVYLMWYGLGRFFIEGLRTDSLLMGSMRVSQMIALICFVSATVILLVISSKIKREADPEYLKLYADTEEAAEILAGTYYARFDKKNPQTPQTETEAETDGDAGTEAEAEAEAETKIETEAETHTDANEETAAMPAMTDSNEEEEENAGENN